MSIPDAAAPGRRGDVRVDRRGPLESRRGPPLVLLGGMTQTLSSWSGQIRSLAAGREVIVYEARGQGQTELSLADASLPRHVDDLIALLDALAIDGPIDLAGFSFGGRVALGVAATHPARIRRLVVSGVGAGRGALGRVIVRGWREALRSGDLEALAWVSLADTLGPAYLERYEAMIPQVIKATVQRNRVEGIRALFEHNLEVAGDDPHAPLRLAARIAAPTLLVAGALDRLAPEGEVAALARAFAGPAEHAILPDVGHTVAIEAAEAWRARVLAFLERPEARAE